MAIGFMKQSNKTTTYINDYVCDHESDILDLPTDIAPGSSAIVIDSGNVYMLNNEHKWQPFGTGSGSSSGGSGGTTIQASYWKPFE